jgi:alpha-beta hydrolase superfamily lysophospholipase
MIEVFMKIQEERESVTLINEGEKIFGILHRPLQKKKVPAIVICPGFAGNKCGKFRLFVVLAEQLAQLGIAVLRFDYRGSGDSEGDFHDLTLESKVSDTLHCLHFLEEDPQIDSNRIGLLGRSLGGLISILAANRSQNIKSLALWAPVFHSTPWQELWIAYKAHQLDASIEAGSLPPHVPNLRFLEEFFKVDLEKELKGLQHIPLLHIHGEEDAVVKREHIEGYKKARAGNQKTRFVPLSHSDHDFSNFSEQKVALEETCKWYKETL